MYLTASDGLDLFPDECLFVDDNPSYVAAAIALGYDGIAIARGATHPDDVPWIASLDDLLARFESR